MSEEWLTQKMIKNALKELHKARELCLNFDSDKDDADAVMDVIHYHVTKVEKLLREVLERR